MPIELPMRFDGERMLWTVPDVYSPAECRAFVAKIEQRGPAIATNKSVTLHTVLVYFNDDFDGGETRFLEHLDDVVVPRAGLVAIFQHKLRHEGCAVRTGTKYAMRSDVIYEGDDRIVGPRVA